jgi:glutathione S-transferase
MRKLYFTTGSPFARAVRIVLDEKGLDYERAETASTPSVEERSQASATLQIPALVDGDLHLWDSAVIIDYLMKSYPNPAPRAGEAPFAERLIRPSHEWQDQLALATVQTLGASTTLISQMQWSGVRHADNAHLTRSAIRNQHVLDWCEAQIEADGGFMPGVVSAQDVLLACFCGFIDKRPLKLTWDDPARPKVRALVDRLHRRASFVANPVLWWEPGITGYTPDGTPIRAAANAS